MKNKYVKKKVKRRTIQRWVLKYVSRNTPETPATLDSIKEFLDSKRNGLSYMPATKLIINRLLENGKLVTLDGKFINPRKSSKVQKPKAQKRRGGSEPKNLVKDSGGSLEGNGQHVKIGDESVYAKNNANYEHRPGQEHQNKDDVDNFGNDAVIKEWFNVFILEAKRLIF